VLIPVLITQVRTSRVRLAVRFVPRWRPVRGWLPGGLRGVCPLSARAGPRGRL